VYMIEAGKISDSGQINMLQFGRTLMPVQNYQRGGSLADKSVTAGDYLP